MVFSSCNSCDSSASRDSGGGGSHSQWWPHDENGEWSKDKSGRVRMGLIVYPNRPGLHHGREEWKISSVGTSFLHFGPSPHYKRA